MTKNNNNEKHSDTPAKFCTSLKDLADLALNWNCNLEIHPNKGKEQLADIYFLCDDGMERKLKGYRMNGNDSPDVSDAQSKKDTDNA